ncbi:MAG: FkbM family methyltransferase [Acidimicrobiia bacterium]
MKEALRRRLLVRPWLARASVRSARMLGANAPARRLASAANDVAIAVLPYSLTGEINGRFVMETWRDTDQVAMAVREHGWGTFEYPMALVFARAVKRARGAIYDVGANTGFYSLLAARTRPDLAVRAFEPFPPPRERLEGNLDLNGLRARVEVVPEAVGPEPGRAALYVPPRDHVLVETSASLNPGFVDGMVSTLEVPVTTVDLFARQAGDRVGVIKIDVESLEHAVLAGAAASLDRDRPVVFVEVLESGDAETIDELRRRAGYVDVQLRPHHAVLGYPVRYEPASWNHLLLPEERLDAGLSFLTEAGLLIAEH